MESSALAAIIGPLLMGLVAVGVLLSIKIARRRQATRAADAGYKPGIGEAVPARPLSQKDAATMMRRYLWSAAAILAAALLAFLLMG
ncbi:hypothetical protein [Solimonas sp. SE-A11]|uniref:hypothetical protein n=1 Tax=Solimonas sp. SE-A11 TaxID=3054954 RepID=UPI00259D0DC5|nr:hypothetical protein [Solimonas sp. SE-A11]MDM4768880.1 hypothetical protein [Solimonas sp. SE-A11]